MFSDHAVLQRGRPVPVWGTAQPGLRVSVAYGAARAEAVTAVDGRWLATLPPLAASAEPFELAVVAGSEAKTFQDVVVGEVWFAAGQSNMEWRLVHSMGGRQTLNQADNRDLRFMMAEPDCAAAPRTDANPAWRKEGEEAAWQPSRTWSANRVGAVPYFMGVALQRELGVPVGVIQAAVGGSRIEAWMPRFAFDAPAFNAERAWLAQADLEQSRREQESLERYKEWFTSVNGAGNELVPPPAWPRSPGAWYNKPTCFFNGMVGGLAPYAVAGMAWYQGESNVPEAEAYLERLQAFIAAMRRIWRDDELPVALVQVAPYAHPATDKLPVLWQAQLDAVRADPKVGYVVISDLVDDLTDLHPPNKRDVGERIARWALHSVYSRGAELPSGPLYKSHSIEGKRIHIRFDHARGLKVRDGAEPQDFEVAGRDGRFVPAKAVIDGEGVVVESQAIARPVAVRFAWSETAQPKLVNQAGLPAAGFRTKP